MRSSRSRCWWSSTTWTSFAGSPTRWSGSSLVASPRGELRARCSTPKTSSRRSLGHCPPIPTERQQKEVEPFMEQMTFASVGGLTLGEISALVALGVVLIFRATDTFNFAHGHFMVLGAFLVGKWQLDTDAPFLLVLLASLLIVGAIGAALYWVVLRKTVGRPHFIPVIA